METSELIRQMLINLGEDPEREGLKATPDRVARAWAHITQGYSETAEEILGSAIFHEEHDEMVIVRDIELYSVCEHHMLPFIGKAHVAYIPNGKLIGLSKIPRLVDMFSHRLQVQERLTTQIADTLVQMIEPQGVGVVIEAVHLCVLMRGVEKQSSKMVTSSMRGVFKDDERTRAEFMHLIGPTTRGGLII